MPRGAERVMKKTFLRTLSVAFVIALLFTNVVSAYASNWSSNGSNNGGWATQTWSYVSYGYNDDGQYYAKRYENGVLVQDIRARGNNLWNDTYQVLLSSWVSNRSSVDLAIDANGNVYGVDSSNNQCVCYDNGYDYPTRLTGYTVNVGTPFKYNENGFVVGIYTSSGLVDLSGNLTNDDSNNFNYGGNYGNGNNGNYGNGGQPPIYGDGPGSNGFGNGGFGGYSSNYTVSPTNLSATTKIITERSTGTYYTYNVSSGKFSYTVNGGNTTYTVRSSGVVNFAPTDDGYINYVYKSNNLYYGVSIAIGSTSGSTKVFSGTDAYTFEVNSNGFVTTFEGENCDYPYLTSTSNSSTTWMLYMSSSLYYKYMITSSGKLGFSKNGSSSISYVSSSDYVGSVVYSSVTDDEEVIMVTRYGSKYYAYLLKIGKTSVSETVFEGSSSYSVTTNDYGFVTKIKSSTRTYTL